MLWRSDFWYKFDQFKYKALAETTLSQLLKQGDIESNTSSFSITA